MSFLYDKKILNQLHYAMNKRAQESTLAEDEKKLAFDKDSVALAKKMIVNLSAEFEGKQIESNVELGGKEELNIDVNALKNIDVFIQRLAESKLKINGYQLVYGRDEYSKMDVEQLGYSGYKKISTKTTRTEEPKAGGGQFYTDDYFVQPKYLTEFIQTLRNKVTALKQSPEESDKGKIYEIMIGSLISSINSLLGQSIELPKKSEPGKPKELPDDEKIDAVKKEFNIAKFPNGEDDPATALLAKDLKSKLDFSNWLERNPIATITTQLQPGYWQVYHWKDDEANRCTIYQILFNRIKIRQNKLNTFTGTAEDLEKEKKILSFYSERIKQLASEDSFNGQACSLTGLPAEPVAPSVKKPGEDKGKDEDEADKKRKKKEEPSGKGELSADKIRIMNNLDFPLEEYAIPLKEIKKFYTEIQKEDIISVEEFDFAEAKTVIDNIITKDLVGQFIKINLGRGALALQLKDNKDYPGLIAQHWLASSPGDISEGIQKYRPFMDNLYSVIYSFNEFLRILYKKYSKQSELLTKMYSEIRQQSGYAQNNFRMINYLKDNAPSFGKSR